MLLSRWFILFLALLILVACAPPATIHTFADLPVGDPGSGEKLFAQSHGDAPPCTTCHTTDGSGKVGPSLKGLSERAGKRVEGQSAEEYIFNSIVRPASFIVPGFTNQMYPNYDKQLDSADIADLIAYVLTL